MDKVEKGPKEIFSPDIQKDLLLLEEQEGSVNFKFGVIYMKQGQSSDDEILSNGKYSNSFTIPLLNLALIFRSIKWICCSGVYFWNNLCEKPQTLK